MCLFLYIWVLVYLSFRLYCCIFMFACFHACCYPWEILARWMSVTRRPSHTQGETAESERQAERVWTADQLFLSFLFTLSFSLSLSHYRCFLHVFTCSLRAVNSAISVFRANYNHNLWSWIRTSLVINFSMPGARDNAGSAWVKKEWTGLGLASAPALLSGFIKIVYRTGSMKNKKVINR